MDYAASPFQIKTLDDVGVIEGLGAFFGNEDLGGDVIKPGAFTKTLAALGSAPLPMLFCHDMQRPIGAWSELRETGEGLQVKGRFTLATRDGAEAFALAKDGALPGLSIGYGIVQESYREGGVRLLEELKLYEVSPVPIPMNERARVQTVKSITSARDIAEILQEAGMSSRKAKAAAGAAWKALNSADDEAQLAEIVRLFEQHTARLGQSRSD